MLCIAVTVLFSAGQFVLFSYFAPYYKHAIGITPLELSLLFVWFGAFGFVGNMLMSRHIERIGAHRAVMAATAVAGAPANFPSNNCPALWSSGVGPESFNSP